MNYWAYREMIKGTTKNGQIRDVEKVIMMTSQDAIDYWRTHSEAEIPPHYSETQILEAFVRYHGAIRVSHIPTPYKTETYHGQIN